MIQIYHGNCGKKADVSELCCNPAGRNLSRMMLSVPNTPQAHASNRRLQCPRIVFANSARRVKAFSMNRSLLILNVMWSFDILILNQLYCPLMATDRLWLSLYRPLLVRGLRWRRPCIRQQQPSAVVSNFRLLPEGIPASRFPLSKIYAKRFQDTHGM